MKRPRPPKRRDGQRMKDQHVPHAGAVLARLMADGNELIETDSDVIGRLVGDAYRERKDNGQ